MKTYLLQKISSITRTLWTVKVDVISLTLFTLALGATGWVAGLFPGGWALSNLLYAAAICAAAVHLPWLFIALCFPKSLNRFINVSWDDAWGRMNDQTKLMLVLGVYCLFALIFAIVAWAVFIGVPVGG